MEGSNSDSDSNQNSVVESGAQNEGFVELPEAEKSAEVVELPEIVRLRNDIKKTQFRGFYLSQKTLVVDSNTSSIDCEPRKRAYSLEAEDEEIIGKEPSIDFEFEEDPASEHIEEPKQDVPTIVEELVNVREEVEEEDDATENSDVPVNIDDKAKIEKDHENPGIDSNFKVSVSQVKHFKEKELSQSFLDVANTSDEDISELVSDVQEIVPEVKLKSKLRISLKSLDSSDEEEQKEDVKSKNRKAQKRVKIKKQSFSSGNETDISDIVVSDMDYYKIRHQTDVQEKEEYCLSWSPTRFVTRMKSFDESQVLNIPNIRTCDIPIGLENDDGNETSDEDFSCFETDFMTMEEFLEAYRTNWEFDKKEEKVKIFKTSSIQNDSESEKDGCNTESLRENLFSENSSIDEDDIEDLEPDTDSEEVPTSLAENHLHEMHSPGCIHFMEHTEIGGIVAFTTPSQKNKWNENFEPEDIVFESDSDGEDDMMTEEIYEDEKTNVLELLDIDDTDEENISDFNDDSIINEKDINLNLSTPKREKEKYKNKSKIHKDDIENNKSSEDEILENFVMSPISEDIPTFPKTSLTQLDGENSTVRSSQNMQTKKKKRKNLNLRNSRKIEIEEI